MSQLPIIQSKGVITSFKRGRSRVHESTILCKIDGFDDRKAAAALIGHWVEWTSETGIKIRAKITRTHGIKGVVRAHLPGKGIPGSALGSPIVVVK
ncbi:MAG: 50S ribosomal protein L35ae [Candidatus Lokiarchaeota archaeon]|nr:50S ribosomal protein L35ae [Candidatus Lokiarchaeota archaeon]